VESFTQIKQRIALVQPFLPSGKPMVEDKRPAGEVGEDTAKGGLQGLPTDDDRLPKGLAAKSRAWALTCS
jgi:hypothetical protein